MNFARVQVVGSETDFLKVLIITDQEHYQYISNINGMEPKAVLFGHSGCWQETNRPSLCIW